MKIEDQVCTVEQAKRLMELGVIPNSYFKWYQKDFASGYRLLAFSDWIGKTVSEIGQLLPAYTVAELGAMLDGQGMPFYHSLWKQWSYRDAGDQPRGYTLEAEARAEMLIDLVKNKLMPPPGNKETMGSTS